MTGRRGTGRSSARSMAVACLGVALAALLGTACSSGSVDTYATVPASTHPDSATTTTTGTGGGATGGSPGTHTAPQPSTGTGGTGTTGSGNSGSGEGGSTKGKTHAARHGGPRGGSKADGGGSSSTLATTGAGLPSLKQQFSDDDAAFRSAAASVQKAVDGASSSTPQQLAQQLFPLLAAANAYQSQLVNLPFSSSTKPLAQSLTERLGQLTAVLEQIQRPGAFFSAAAVRAAIASAEGSVRSASNALRAQV